ncbi:hypothetical protein JKP88DRAFT_276174 [Tribonema minus]|uniref:Uncharacterized protein n=1 Tax=Tribonema minus TaxID=303371 RepID=A0A835Z879_9STRA|nr:hypothetical protein JKP88DRAFT_276174 [Tribonema minus]
MAGESTTHEFNRKIRRPKMLKAFLSKKHALYESVDLGTADHVVLHFKEPVAAEDAQKLMASYSEPNLRLQVLNDKKNKNGDNITTAGGLTKTDLVKVAIKSNDPNAKPRFRIVSKTMSDTARKCEPLQLKLWRNAVMEARKSLGVVGFVAIRKETPLYAKIRELYDQDLLKHADELEADRLKNKEMRQKLSSDKLASGVTRTRVSKTGAKAAKRKRTVKNATKKRA